MSRFDWYVIQSHPRKEPFVRARIQDLGREVFLPMVAERVPGRRRSGLAPLFPGYLFARLCGEEGDFPRVRWSHGVRRVLGDAHQPRPLHQPKFSHLASLSTQRLRCMLKAGYSGQVVFSREWSTSGAMGDCDLTSSQTCFLITRSFTG